MNAFIVEARDRPGELARITEAVAARDVGLVVTALHIGEAGGCSFLADDEESARVALKEIGASYRETPVVFARLLEQPGQAASITRKMAHAGVNIEMFLVTDTRDETCTVALGVEDVDAATKALGDQVTDWSF